MTVREFVESNDELCRSKASGGKEPVALEYVAYDNASDDVDQAQVPVDVGDEGILSRSLKKWYMVLDPRTFRGIRVYMVME